MSEVRLTLKTDSLLNLPSGASFHAKNGRATLDVSKGTEPGTIMVYASCDSLQRLVEYYERLVSEYKATIDRQTEEVAEERKPPDRHRLIFAALIVGFVSGIIVILKIKKQNGKE